MSLLYNTSSFSQNKPKHAEHWLLGTTANEVLFTAR
jgi:hypothetical protein